MEELAFAESDAKGKRIQRFLAIDSLKCQLWRCERIVHRGKRTIRCSLLLVIC